MPLTPTSPIDYEFPTLKELLRCRPPPPPPLSPSKRQNLQAPFQLTPPSHPATSTRTKEPTKATGDSVKEKIPAGASISKFRPKDLEELVYAARDTRVLRESKKKGDAYEKLHFLLKNDPNRDFQAQVTTGTVREKLKGLLLWHEFGDQCCPSAKDERLRRAVANLLDDTDMGIRLDSTLDQLMFDQEQATQAQEQKTEDKAKVNDENERGGIALRDAYRKTYAQKRKAIEFSSDEGSDTGEEQHPNSKRSVSRRKTGRDSLLNIYAKDKEEREKKQERMMGQMESYLGGYNTRLDKTLSSLDELLELKKSRLRRQLDGDE